MNFDFELEDMLDFLRENLYMVLAVAMILLLLIGYLIFTFGTLLPRWQQRTELAAASATVAAAYEARTAQEQSDAGQLGPQIEAAQAEFDELANHFLTEDQAIAFLDGLYDSAAETAVTIVDLQAQAVAPDAAAAGEKPVYDTRQFRLVAEGDLVRLNQFVGRIGETSVPSINLRNLVVAQGADDSAAVLTLDLLLYTSPFSTGEAVADLPDPQATPAATQAPQPSPTPAASATPDISSLLAQLDAPWAAENWPEVIGLIQEIRQLAPNEAGMTEKLYAARVLWVSAGRTGRHDRRR